MKHKTVLVVDDELIIRDLVYDILRRAGYVVTTEADARKALRQCQQGTSYDLVITDVDMPHLNGIELAQALLRRNCQQRIVVMSGGNFQALREAELLGLPTLSKPFRSGELRQVVHEALRGSV